jgi:serine protease Do
MNVRCGRRKLVLASVALALVSLSPGAGPDSAAGTSFRVPYRLTQTNHYLVRVRINGKGPFNFLVDTGAPALFVGTEAAKKAGLAPSQTNYWTIVERLDLEGGATLRRVKARVDDPFQLTGMNALGLPGTSIDGILGFTILARFRMEFDPTQDRMVWTLLNYEPKDPPVPRRGEEKALPPELQVMNLLGPVAKSLAFFVGKQPEERLQPRGFLGMELAGADGEVRVTGVLSDSPAAKAGLQPADRLVRLLGRDVKDLKAAHEGVAQIRAGDAVKLTVRRGPDDLDLVVVAGEGF